jgi:hypothetical protein
MRVEAMHHQGVDRATIEALRRRYDASRSTRSPAASPPTLYVRSPLLAIDRRYGPVVLLERLGPYGIVRRPDGLVCWIDTRLPPPDGWSPRAFAGSDEALESVRRRILRHCRGGLKI